MCILCLRAEPTIFVMPEAKYGAPIIISVYLH